MQEGSVFLPFDIVYEHVLPHLSITQVLRLGKLSKAWYAVSRNDRAYMHHTRRVITSVPEMKPVFDKHAQNPQQRHVKRRKTSARTRKWVRPKGHWNVYARYLLKLVHDTRSIRTYKQNIGTYTSADLRLGLTMCIIRCNLLGGLEAPLGSAWEFETDHVNCDYEIEILAWGFDTFIRIRFNYNANLYYGSQTPDTLFAPMRIGVIATRSVRGRNWIQPVGCFLENRLDSIHDDHNCDVVPIYRNGSYDLNIPRLE